MAPPTSASGQQGVRLAELLAVLSLGADLGMGQPMEHAMRQCLIALRLGERLGLDEQERANLYYTSLIAWVGCHVDAYEQAKWFGDDLALKHDFRYVDFKSAGAGMSFMFNHLGKGQPAAERAKTTVGFLSKGRSDGEDMLANHWYAADQLAANVGLSQGVRDTLLQTFERWDGKGIPNGVQGDAILVTSRIVNMADVLEVYHRTGGITAATAMVQQRCGTQFDPEMCSVVTQDAELLFADLDEATTWDVVIAAEPALTTPLTDAELDTVLEAVADFTDIKSPYTLGHSRGVAELAAAAAAHAGLSAQQSTATRRAGLLHDLGRLGVSNNVWDKQGALTAAETERVRLHPYLTERMLASSPALAAFGEIAVQHHERLDGSGYPRGLRGDSLTMSGRVLGAADAYHGKLEPRPHRPAATAAQAAQHLRDEVRAGRLDTDAVDAVLVAAGHQARKRKDWPAGLTTREVDVLRLLARGLSNKEIAERLVISRKTADNHVEHIYTKLGVRNRARASLFAARNGLMSPAEDGDFTP